LRDMLVGEVTGTLPLGRHDYLAIHARTCSFFMCRIFLWWLFWLVMLSWITVSAINALYSMELVVKIRRMVESTGLKRQARVLLLRSMVHRVDHCLVVSMPRRASDLVKCSLMLPTKLITYWIVPNSLVNDINKKCLTIFIFNAY